MTALELFAGAGGASAASLRSELCPFRLAFYDMSAALPEIAWESMLGSMCRISSNVLE